jgi:hypothetical protein
LPMTMLPVRRQAEFAQTCAGITASEYGRINVDY